MPRRPPKPCVISGCPALVEIGTSFCPEHKYLAQKATDKRRGSSAQRGYGNRWRRYRLGYLARNPLCVECRKQKRVEAATVVDHIRPHKGNMKLFWDMKNHQGLCASCHSRKTATEDGGFGHERSSV